MDYLILSNRWEIKAIDLRTAFLKQIEQTVYLGRPKKVNTPKLWKFNKKCVYDLAVASRYWNLHVREELNKLAANISSVDQVFSIGMKTSV